MLKTLSTESAKPRKGLVEVSDNNKAGRYRNELDGSGIDNSEIDSGKVGDNEVGKKAWNPSKSKIRLNPKIRLSPK